MAERLTRFARCVRAALGAAGDVRARAAPTLAAAFSVPRLVGISVRNSGRPYEGDRRLFATVSPGIARAETPR